jgi:hypothetical protein
MTLRELSVVKCCTLETVDFAHQGHFAVCFMLDSDGIHPEGYLFSLRPDLEDVLAKVKLLLLSSTDSFL